MVSRRSKACDIPERVKKRVWERDGGRCVVCGSCVNVMPNAHYIPRSKGGLGVEQNIVTLCTNFGPGQCHYRFDFGTRAEREAIGEAIEEYLRGQYPDWDPERLVYSKWN